MHSCNLITASSVPLTTPEQTTNSVTVRWNTVPGPIMLYNLRVFDVNRNVIQTIPVLPSQAINNQFTQPITNLEPGENYMIVLSVMTDTNEEFDISTITTLSASECLYFTHIIRKDMPDFDINQ